MRLRYLLPILFAVLIFGTVALLVVHLIAGAHRLIEVRIDQLPTPTTTRPVELPTAADVWTDPPPAPGPEWSTPIRPATPEEMPPPDPNATMPPADPDACHAMNAGDPRADELCAIDPAHLPDWIAHWNDPPTTP